MKLIIYTLTLFICQSGSLKAQSIAKDILTVKPDSCYLSIYEAVTKEMTMPFEAPYEIELATHKISNKDSETLLKKASKKSSYQDSRALLTHYNVLFSFYKNDTICSTIQLSTLTGNIEIHHLSTHEAFYSRVSGKLGRYLINTFKKYEVFELIDASDMQALHEKRAP